MPGGATEFAATVISALPYVDTNAPTGATDEFWYVYTPPADGIVGMRTADNAVDYAPGISYYFGSPGSLSGYMFGGFFVEEDRPITFPVWAGQAVYIKIENTAPAGGPSGTVGFAFYAGFTPITTWPAGTIFITDDQSYDNTPTGEPKGYPGYIFSGVNGDQITQNRDFPAGEEADIIPESGIIAIEDFNDPFGVSLFDRTLQPLFLNLPFLGNIRGITRYSTTSFLVMEQSGTLSPLVTVLNVDGTSGLTWTLPSGFSVGSLTVDPVLNILYYTNAAAGIVIKRFDLTGNAPLSDFVSIASRQTQQLVALSDSTLLVMINWTPLSIREVRRYDAAANLLNTYPVAFVDGGLPGPADTFLDHIARNTANGVADDTAFWAWLQSTIVGPPTNDINGFYKIRISDGAILTAIEPVYGFEGGIGPAGLDPDTPLYGGTPISCPLLILSAAAASGVGVLGPIAWLEWKRAVP